MTFRNESQKGWNILECAVSSLIYLTCVEARSLLMSRDIIVIYYFIMEYGDIWRGVGVSMEQVYYSHHFKQL